MEVMLNALKSLFINARLGSAGHFSHVRSFLSILYIIFMAS